ncbi:P-loop containing nucleoside triphosphate hydrolase protein, partial [Trametopsis cervina]
LSSESAASSVPDVDTIRAKCQQAFGLRPCRVQVLFGQAILRGEDVVLEMGTGLGKTLAFWLPMLFRPRGIQIIVTALNLLGDQNVDQLHRAGIKAISINSKSATAQNFRDIEDGLYRAIIVSPEQLMKQGGGFEKLLKKPAFVAHLISVIFDEAHCISTWGTFRPEYRMINRLRHVVLKNTLFAIASATLSATVKEDVIEILMMRRDKLLYLLRSTDRPNIHIAIRKMQYAVNSYQDLAFVLQQPPNTTPPKFLIFSNTISETVSAGRALRNILPLELRHKIVWFHSEMSEKFKRGHVEKLRLGEIWGICCTDSFGLGIDIPDVSLVIQFRATCTLIELWQRFGRWGRSRETEATGIFLVEPKHFDEEREKAAKRKELGQAVKKRKRDAARLGKGKERENPPAKHGDNHSDSGSEDGDSESDVDGPGEVPAGGSGTAAEVLIEDEESRRMRYAERPEAESKKPKKQERKLEAAMDDLINAERRKLKCRKTPLALTFNFDQAVSDHLLCDPSQPLGCQRCLLPLARLCCDLHNRLAIDTLHPATSIDKPAHIPARSRLRKFDTIRQDMDLRDVLDDWRIEKTIAQFGEGTYEDRGPGLVMPDETLRRIVDCVHHHKINSGEDIRRETKWGRADQYGAELVMLIRELYPVVDVQPRAAMSTAPLLRGTTTVVAAVTKAARIMTCGACGKEGHTKRSKTCEQYGKA